jgi:YidC/Oxa1 family membrane protein insertase
MDNFRILLFLALGLILFALYGEWQQWEQKKAAPVATSTAPSAEPAAAAPSDSAPVPAVPAVAPATKGGAPAVEAAAVESGRRIAVRTDLFDAAIDTQGGDLRVLKLQLYPVAADRPNEPFRLLTDEPGAFYIAQSGLVGHEGVFPTHKVAFEAAQNSYVLAANDKELRVPLMWRAPDGTRYIKTYVFRRNDYTVDVEFKVENAGKRDWRGYFYGQLQRVGVEAPGMFALPTYTGGAIYTPEDNYQKIAFKDMAEKPLKREVTGGWVAMLQHYFVGAWMPEATARSQFWTDARPNNHFVIGYTSLDATAVAPGASAVLKGQLYVGPKERKRLEQLVTGMDLTVDYGALTVIAAPLYWVLDWIHRAVGNWGWAIVLLTILIKIAFYPLSAASYKSMAKMKKLAPRLQALKERYGDDRQKLNQAMMELYQTEKINPLGGCLPIVIQIPVFIALYWVLLESVEMRQAPWVLWIRDLSTQDPYYVLPIIMGATMYAQQLLNPQPLDPVQKKVFMILPGVFTFLFLFFPAGLVLYWTVNNMLSIAQQWRINSVLGATKS